MSGFDHSRWRTSNPVSGCAQVRSQPVDGAVTVEPRRKLARFAQSQSPRLGLREIDAIHEVARRSSTWQR